MYIVCFTNKYMTFFNVMEKYPTFAQSLKNLKIKIYIELTTSFNTFTTISNKYF